MNLLPIKQAIAEACDRAGRQAAEIKLIAVSKGQDFAKIHQAYEQGQRDFGENYAGELALKQKLAREQELLDIKWHYLGAIQTNKIKLIIEADFIHGVGEIRHAVLINKIANKTIGIFLQVNLNPNDGRHGFREEDLPRAIEQIKLLPRLYLQGLMTITPTEGALNPSFWFKKMSRLGQLYNLDLSMGMSEDFSEAITYGANFVRIGSKIFGPRI